MQTHGFLVVCGWFLLLEAAQVYLPSTHPSERKYHSDKKDTREQVRESVCVTLNTMLER